MILQTIEQVLRDFDWYNYGLDEFAGVDDPERHEWPPVLAAQIVQAIIPDIGAALARAVVVAADSTWD